MIAGRVGWQWDTNKARKSFLRLGASEVFVGDGPAMDRDTEAILESVRLKEFTGPLGREFP